MECSLCRKECRDAKCTDSSDDSGPDVAFAVEDVPPKSWVDTTETLTETTDGNLRRTYRSGRRCMESRVLGNAKVKDRAVPLGPVAKYTPTSVSVYVNGVWKASKEIKQRYPAGAVYKIGASIHKEVDAFQGKLKDVQLYDKSLTPEQIKTALAGKSPEQCE